jgi:hypothetical protein
MNNRQIAMALRILADKIEASGPKFDQTDPLARDYARFVTKAGGRNKNLKLKAQIVRQFGKQADFAHFMNINDALVSKVVNGSRRLTKSGQAAWAKALECDIEIFNYNSARKEKP